MPLAVIPIFFFAVLKDLARARRVVAYSFLSVVLATDDKRPKFLSHVHQGDFTAPALEGFLRASSAATLAVCLAHA